MLFDDVRPVEEVSRHWSVQKSCSRCVPFQGLISKKGVCPFREKSFEGLQAYCCLVVVRRLVHEVFPSGGKIAARGAAVSGLQNIFFLFAVWLRNSRPEASARPRATWEATHGERGGIGGNYKSLMIVLGHVALWGCL